MAMWDTPELDKHAEIVEDFTELGERLRQLEDKFDLLADAMITNQTTALKDITAELQSIRSMHSVIENDLGVRQLKTEYHVQA